ncbi:MAG: metallophosphoesterase [Parabacteroides sp.]|nr:metallophosphoesterase [Parabacteroides sp.]
MKNRINTVQTFLLSMAVIALTSCEKVSPTGILIGGSGTDDRVEMSVLYYKMHYNEVLDGEVDGDYSFLVGADSHLTEDTCRMAEMLQNGLDHDDLLLTHLGDIADTKAEYYINLENTLATFREKYISKHYTYDEEREVYVEIESGDAVKKEDIIYPFFPVVGNHDITHNGWALYSNIFHSSFYEFTVKIGDTGLYDHFIFLDSANGTLGDYQTDLIDLGLWLDVEGKTIRNTFVFTHSNLFRPSSNQFSSTFPREELYYLLNKVSEWNTTIMFCGHVHAWDDRVVNGVRYLTLDSMSEQNSPEPGDYLVRVTCSKDGEVKYEKVHMNYTPKK